MARYLPVLVLLSLVGALLAAAGCEAKAGDPCQAGTATCLDQHTKLSCLNGRYTQSPCRGPLGCRNSAGKNLCDVTTNREGDVCSTDDEGKGECSPDGKHLVRCNGGKYTFTLCRGPGGCNTKDGDSTCDQSRAEVGDACGTTTGSACSLDGKQMVRCDGGKFVATEVCRGELGCHGADGKVQCDKSRAEIGDACTDGGACSADGKQVLTCKDGKMALRYACRGAVGCQLEGGNVKCAEPGLGEVGDPCDGEGATCTPAFDAMLDCKAGKLTLGTKCKCWVKDGKVGCN